MYARILMKETVIRERKTSVKIKIRKNHKGSVSISIGNKEKDAKNQVHSFRRVILFLNPSEYNNHPI